MKAKMINIDKLIFFLFYFCVGVCNSALCQKMSRSFSSIHFDSIAVYKAKYISCKAEVVINDTVNTCFVFYKSIDTRKVESFTNIISDTSTYGGNYWSCSTFNLGLVFYYKSKIVSYVSMGTGCGNVKFSHRVSAYEKYKKDAGSVGCYIYSTFSAIGKQKLNAFFAANAIENRIR